MAVTVPCNNSHRVWGVTPNLAKLICESLAVFFFFFWEHFLDFLQDSVRQGHQSRCFLGGGAEGGMCLLVSWGCMDSDSHESGALMQISFLKKAEWH